jgi:hypothetical protein
VKNIQDGYAAVDVAGMTLLGSKIKRINIVAGDGGSGNKATELLSWEKIFQMPMPSELF